MSIAVYVSISSLMWAFLQLIITLWELRTYDARIEWFAFRAADLLQNCLSIEEIENTGVHSPEFRTVELSSVTN